ncbi:hypothetical protein [Pseudomonas sp. MWU16-30317]|uniref:hypothetical protein n=1 Tax=Pseudomonas sp. MWU16-30317 TaxID=2878095 RepID=UPI001CFBA50F|nr:hypothetical protein [Pseudomonas sp. MWU16-30317]
MNRVSLCTAALILGQLTPIAASASASAPELRSVEPVKGQGVLHYYESDDAQSAGKVPTAAVIAIHGHPRDALRTFQATATAVKGTDTLVVAPLFQVDERHSDRCVSAGEPLAEPGDLLWTCSSWIAGEPANNAPGVSAFNALDAVVAQVHEQFPSVKTITVAGFSAGAQMVQHAIAFAAPAPTGVTLRYVVADPGTWLYFDTWRASATTGCADFNQWKYGLDGLPAWLKKTPEQARERYATADIRYLEGELDSSNAKGTFYPILDKSCAAMAQGPYRLQRGQAYQTYEREQLKPNKPRPLAIVPGCAHEVTCVFPSAEGRAALLGQ